MLRKLLKHNLKNTWVILKGKICYSSKKSLFMWQSDQFGYQRNTGVQPVFAGYHLSSVHFYDILWTHKIIHEKWLNNALEKNGTRWELVARQYMALVSKLTRESGLQGSNPDLIHHYFSHPTHFEDHLRGKECDNQTSFSVPDSFSW